MWGDSGSSCESSSFVGEVSSCRSNSFVGEVSSCRSSSFVKYGSDISHENQFSALKEMMEPPMAMEQPRVMQSMECQPAHR